MNESDYILKPHRLADLIAAIQVMGTYSYSARAVDSWSKLLGDKPRSAETWVEVFNQHPEFFRAGIQDNGQHTLALRRAQPRVFNTKTSKEITTDEFEQLSDEEKKKYSRKPLSAPQITFLVEVAIRLQSQAIAQRQERRWWMPHVMSVITLIIGLVTGALLKYL